MQLVEQTLENIFYFRSDKIRKSFQLRFFCKTQDRLLTNYEKQKAFRALDNTKKTKIK